MIVAMIVIVMIVAVIVMIVTLIMMVVIVAVMMMPVIAIVMVIAAKQAERFAAHFALPCVNSFSNSESDERIAVVFGSITFL